MSEAIWALGGVLVEMLSHKSYMDRSFDAIRKKIDGYSDTEIRQLLHEVDARKTGRKDRED